MGAEEAKLVLFLMSHRTRSHLFQHVQTRFKCSSMHTKISSFLSFFRARFQLERHVVENGLIVRNVMPRMRKMDTCCVKRWRWHLLVKNAKRFSERIWRKYALWSMMDCVLIGN